MLCCTLNETSLSDWPFTASRERWQIFNSAFHHITVPINKNIMIEILFDFVFFLHFERVGALVSSHNFDRIWSTGFPQVVFVKTVVNCKSQTAWTSDIMPANVIITYKASKGGRMQWNTGNWSTVCTMVTTLFDTFYNMLDNLCNSLLQVKVH